MEKSPIKKSFLSESIKYPLVFFLIILLVFYIYTFFNPMPTEIQYANIGLGSDYLEIGDRTFYFHNDSIEYGIKYKSNLIKGGFLYPLLLNILEFIINKLGLGEVAWNTAVILTASLSAIASLFFIDKSANIIFGKKIATRWRGSDMFR